MPICCVPSCFTNSRKCHSSITFHEFPTNPDMHAKWIKNINTVVKNGGSWFPTEKPLICSKHFLPGDFKRDCKYPLLKPRSVPTIFTNILGFTYKRKEFTHSPLIVKIAKKSEGEIDSAKSEKRPCKRPRSLANVVERQVGDFRLPNGLQHVSENSGINCEQNVKCCVMNKNVMSNCDGDVSLGSLQPAYTTGLEVQNADSIKGLHSNCSPVEKCGSSQSLKKVGGMATKKKSSELELIEIGPNTFLKINPDVIKVTKKITPSGNHVLQFIMNKKSVSEKSLPSLLATGTSGEVHTENDHTSITNMQLIQDNCTSHNGMNTHIGSHNNVEHVLGHLIENHLYKEINYQPQESEVNCRNVSSDHNSIDDSRDIIGTNRKNDSKTCLAESECIANAPMLLTTNVPVSHCFTDKQKLVMQLKQKTRLINSLRAKISRLTKRLEDIENKCVVQERQLSYTNVKKLKAIKRNAAKGDASAIYILEQIRAYSGRTKMHWSDSTLRQCGVWCKKAPYAYEYFKKAGLFKLPCLSTVKRFMKKNPEQQPDDKLPDGNIDENDSSSDFNFDDSDDDDSNNIDNNVIADSSVGCKMLRNKTNMDNPNTKVCDGDFVSEREIIQIQAVSTESQNVVYESRQCNENSVSAASSFIGENSSIRFNNLSLSRTCVTDFQNSTQMQPTFQRNSGTQEIVLQNGEVVQCLNSKLSNGQNIDGQYYIIPTLEEPTILADHQYSVVQSQGVPLIIQNVQNHDLSLEESQQLIFIAQAENQAANNQGKTD